VEVQAAALPAVDDDEERVPALIEPFGRIRVGDDVGDFEVGLDGLAFLAKFESLREKRLLQRDADGISQDFSRSFVLQDGQRTAIEIPDLAVEGDRMLVLRFSVLGSKGSDRVENVV